MTFVELPQFTKAINDLVDDLDYALFQRDLMINPHSGKVIPKSGGLRKVRMRLPGRGKSGGARVIYLYLEDKSAVVLFYIYTKAKSDNLSPDILQQLRAIAEVIKKEFKHEKTRD